MSERELIVKLLGMLVEKTETTPTTPYDNLSPLRVGNAVLIRTVTNYHTGRVVAVTEHEVLIEDAAWICDTGRFFDAFRDGEFIEFEAFPDGVISVGRGSIVDVAAWPHPLPRGQK